MSIKKASEIQEGDEVNFWPGFAAEQIVTRATPICNRTTQAELILIEVNGDKDALKWPPETEIFVVEN